MRRTLTLLLLILFCWLPLAQAQPSLRLRTLVFTHVTVIDTLRGSLNKDFTVVISGDRIIALGKTGRVRIPTDAEVVDATGKFLMPGLWDMHFHAPDDKQAREIFFPRARSAQAKKESSPIFSCSTQIPLKQLATLARLRA